MSDYPQGNQQSPDSSGMIFDRQPVAKDTHADSGMTFDSSPVQQDTPVGPDGKATQSDPRKTGEIVNDVGNKVIVPKDGESFADTMKRAVVYHSSLTPEQRQAAINRETATLPKKTAQTLGAAATAGIVGPAALAIPGEIAEAVPQS